MKERSGEQEFLKILESSLRAVEKIVFGEIEGNKPETGEKAVR